MPKFRRSAWWFIVTSTIAGMYGALSVLGLDHPMSASPILKVTALVVCIGALWKVIWDQQRELDSYKNPVFNFHVEPKDKLQRDPSCHAIYGRICVRNKSNHIAKGCRFVLKSWTFESVGLNEDTALSIKDEPGVSVDIHPKDTKQFNLYYSLLQWDTNVIQENHIYAPNIPRMSDAEGGFSMDFLLTGDNVETRGYRLLFTIGHDKSIRMNSIIDIAVG